MSLTYDYYPAVLYAINEISQGRTKTYACDAANISIPTFEEYVARDPSLQTMYIDAERRGYDAMADALLTINRVEVNGKDNLYGETNPQMAKVVSDNIKWLLSKRRTKDYGDKLEIKHEITLDRAIVDALHAARARATSRTIEHEDTAPKLIEAVSNVVVEDVEDEDAILAELLG